MTQNNVSSSAKAACQCRHRPWHSLRMLHSRNCGASVALSLIQTLCQYLSASALTVVLSDCRKTLSIPARKRSSQLPTRLQEVCVQPLVCKVTPAIIKSGAFQLLVSGIPRHFKFVSQGHLTIPFLRDGVLVCPR